MDLRLLLLCVAICVAHTSTKPMEKKDRVHHDAPLSDKEHDDEENFEYDHEAFLGQEEAKTFDQLTPEESKERLGYKSTHHIHFSTLSTAVKVNISVR